uniref:Ig-like domain-containing protein n=1 Tax=Salvator merianae TaxID=96440 RepID=A0A8D0B6T5_SALMN
MVLLLSLTIDDLHSHASLSSILQSFAGDEWPSASAPKELFPAGAVPLYPKKPVHTWIACSGTGLVLLTMTHGDSVSQTEGPVFVQEGQHVELICGYETTYAASTLFWYEQKPLQPPELLLSSLYVDNEHQRGFSAKKEQKHFNLTKAAAELGDSAVYFCALGDTVRRKRRCARPKPTQQLSRMWWNHQQADAP